MQAIGEQGYEYPMPIQEAVIPVLLGLGDETGWQGDLVALAQTGTGKTAAYGLPIEVYFFTKEKAWAAYERQQSDIFDHLLTIVPEFGLKLYQRP